MRARIYISLLTVSLLIYLSGGNPAKTNSIGNHGDTLLAEVSYGEEFLLDGRYDLNDEELSRIIDSLKKIPGQNSAITELSFFREIRRKDKADIEITLDSLFQLDTIPYGLINELNLLLMNFQPEMDSKNSLLLSIAKDNSGIPCNQLYGGHWDIHHPFQYPPELLASDSSFMILLQEPKEMRFFKHPVSDQSINKYGGLVTSPFGWRDGRNHNGVDIELDRWDSIPCAFDGKVRMAKNYQGYGKVVVVRHYNGLETLYAHMQKISVKSGQIVKAGDLLGLGGSTGNSTGSHLHFEVRYKGIPINPSNLIDFREKDLLSDTLLVRKMRNSLVGTPVGVKFHTIERGDYLQKVAQRYGITVTELCAMNNISPRIRLRIGQRLRVSN